MPRPIQRKEPSTSHESRSPAIQSRIGPIGSPCHVRLIETAKELAIEDNIESGQERSLNDSDFDKALDSVQPSTREWLRTARNLVKYAGDDGSYRDVEVYLKKAKML